MKIRTLWLVGLAFVITGCGEKEQAMPAAEDVDAAAAEGMPVTEPAEMGTDKFIEHMHAHAEQLDKIVAALSFGKLEAARTPAYWLARHERVSGPLYDWEVYLDEMTAGARDVGDAPDLATARAATKRIIEGCQGCHAATNVEVVIAGPTAK